MTPPFHLVAGARPNFMKLAPVARALTAAGDLPFRIIHTGQHYDPAMSGFFFAELGIPAPDVHLEVRSGSHGAQTARILERYEALLLEEKPAATVVFGDVNSTVACALAAVKLGVPVVHVEAGLRSFDRTMPEEINRLLTDAISNLLLVSEPSGVENLRREGVPDSRVRLVGNVMIDTLRAELARAREFDVVTDLGLAPKGYGLITLHRPSNVDDPRVLTALLELFGELARELPLVFPVHPRTRAALERAGIWERLPAKRGQASWPPTPGGETLPGSSAAAFDSRGLAAATVTPRGLVALDPLPYRANLALMASAKLVLTDSGGMQEETTALGIPCLTLRDNTERPITVERGTSRLVGNDPQRIRAAFGDALAGRWPPGEAIPLWDGHAAERVAAALREWILD